MTSIICWTLVSLLILFSLMFLEISRASKSWISFGLILCFLTRVLVSIALSGGLKYIFVIDSLSYEYNGWLLAQPWMSGDLFLSLTPDKSGRFNYYVIFVSWIFRLFGQEPLVATICNCVFSTATIGLLALIYKDFLASSNPDQQQKNYRNVLILIGLLSIYPSYLVWSATNTRDPLYFFCCALFFLSFLTTFSRRSKAQPFVRIISFFISVFSIWLVLGVRNYVNWLFIISIAAALVLFFISKKIHWPKLSILLASSAILSLFACQIFIPGVTAHWLSVLETTRDSFANLKLLDSVAKSSFGLDYSFHSVFDVLLFLPSAVAHYFLGPFPWEVASMVQAVALVESLAIYFLLVPTYTGIRKIYKNAPFETITLLCFVFTFSISQSLVISNMGTIFRHRTLPFLFLFIFTCEGLYEIAKKNFPTIFKA